MTPRDMTQLSFVLRLAADTLHVWNVDKYPENIKLISELQQWADKVWHERTKEYESQLRVA